MPIKKEYRSLYPANWNDISMQVKAEQNWNCQFCGVHHHAVGYREDGCFNPSCGNAIVDCYGIGINYSTGKLLTHKEAQEYADFETENDELGNKYFVIVLTTAHLDHNPQNNKRDNLAALCQQCHNQYDGTHRAKNRSITIKHKKFKNQLKLDL